MYTITGAQQNILMKKNFSFYIREEKCLGRVIEEN
jgi:hypothetical protein